MYLQQPRVLRPAKVVGTWHILIRRLLAESGQKGGEPRPLISPTQGRFTVRLMVDLWLEHRTAFERFMARLGSVYPGN